MLELIKQKGVKTVAASVKAVAASGKTMAASGKTLAASVKTVAASAKTVAAFAKTVAASEKRNEIRKEKCTGTNESLIPYLFDVEFLFDVGECHAANHFVSPVEIFLKYPQKRFPKKQRNHPKKI